MVFQMHHLRLEFCFIFRGGGGLLQDFLPDEVAFFPRGISINNHLPPILLSIRSVFI